MPKRTKKSTAAEKEPNDHAPVCHIDGCQEAGIYKAPKSKFSLHEYAWYCLDHVREYNQKWDYFSGMDRQQIESFMRDAVTGHRPTWAREEVPLYTPEALEQAFEIFMRMGGRAKKPRKREPGVSAKVNDALAALDMEYPYTFSDLKTRYRMLTKKFHPDAHRGDKDIEERFKLITASYLVLSQHLKQS